MSSKTATTTATDSQMRIGHYRLMRTIGKGSFGKVKVAQHDKTGHRVAVKIINREKIKSSQVDKKIKREISILKLFKHPHVIRLYEVIETMTDIFLIMEYVSGGELFDYIVSRGKLTEDDARRFFQQIVSGVEYCHLFRVAHRDLKPENLLLDAEKNVKIADFGLSNIMNDGEFLRTSCGSPNYAAPEVISGKLYAGPEVDVWSCGVILFALLCGRLPFDEDSIPALFHKIRDGDYHLPSHLSPLSRDLIARMLVVDPLSRMSIAEIRNHAWFQVNLPLYLSVVPDVSQQQTEIEEDILSQVMVKMEVDRTTALECLRSDDMNEITVAYNLIADHQRQMVSHQSGSVPVAIAMSPPQHAFSAVASPMLSGVGSPFDRVMEVGSLGATPSSLGQTMRPVPMKSHKGMAQGPLLWGLGVRSTLAAHPTFDKIYDALEELNFDWKPLGEFHVCARQPKGSDDPNCVKIGVQMFAVPEGGHLIELRKLGGLSFPFLDSSALLYRNLYEKFRT
eukprot:TRINITY_DN62_c0_g1_i1.p1 TRINITY_DN62_c0_g1~~TRINITY_DN62_c0_g1_i1.p1  ORF type:complete len:508 (-),score=123.69 TRINITY_DN62_c0_g1_i1:259-1782(-)